MNALDQSISRRIHNLRAPWLDYALLPPGLMFGSFGVPVLIVALGAWLGWRFGFACTLAAISTVALTGPLKHYLGRPRPEAMPGHRAFSLRKLVNNPALPSGDSAQAGMFAAMLVLAGPFDDGRRWVFVALAPLCMFSRVYYGAHWIGDTVVGAVIGALVGTAYAVWFGSWMG
jgi:undecaprenyl-diphosphatase